MSSRAILLFLALSSTACAVSEQVGRLQPPGNPRYHTDSELGEVAFHFDTTYNKALVFGRTLALGLLALWVFKAGAGRSLVLTMIAIAVLGAAVWLLVPDLPTLGRYEVRAGKNGLELSIPPEPPRHIEWSELEEMRISGHEWIGTRSPMRGGADFGRLAEWQTMELRLAGGEEIVVDLERLSVEHRQNCWRAIAAHAQLTEDRPSSPLPFPIPGPG